MKIFVTLIRQIVINQISNVHMPWQLTWLDNRNIADTIFLSFQLQASELFVKWVPGTASCNMIVKLYGSMVLFLLWG